jgi:hypothetical protein
MEQEPYPTGYEYAPMPALSLRDDGLDWYLGIRAVEPSNITRAEQNIPAVQPCAPFPPEETWAKM